MPRQLLSNTNETCSSPTMFKRLRNKLTSNKSTQDLGPPKDDVKTGLPTTPDIGKSHSSFNTTGLTLLAANEAPPAYEPNPEASKPDIPRSAASPVPSISSITSAEDKYAFLSTFDTVFVIDDSGSMAGRSWREVREVLSTIAPICTSHDPDGIDVYFLNHQSSATASGTQAPGGYFHIRDADQVSEVFRKVNPSGSTPTGTRLDSILKPYVSHIARRAEYIDSTKPVNIIVITDGCPTDDLEGIIVHHARKLDQIEAPPHQVGIQFFQVGNAFGATKALRELDDELSEQKIRDMVDTATWNSTTVNKTQSLTAGGILKVVLGAVVRRLDRQPTHDTPQGRGR
jgi:uncharacterized protein YegL